MAEKLLYEVPNPPPPPIKFEGLEKYNMKFGHNLLTFYINNPQVPVCLESNPSSFLSQNGDFGEARFYRFPACVRNVGCFLCCLMVLLCYSGAVYQEGSIDPGDLIIQANDTPFTNMSNDDAVKVLRDLAKKPGSVQLSHNHFYSTKTWSRKA